MAEFVHLHLHSEFSLLDGMIKPKDLMRHCKKNNMQAVAITDHGNMYGVVKFFKAAKAKGIKPIIGCEVYVAPGSRRDTSKEQASPNHLVLLAENKVGYKNLIQLVTKGHLEGFYRRPRVDKDLLEEYNEGLICLSACLQGEIAQAIVQDKVKKAMDATDFYRNVFLDRFYIELQENGIPEQAKANEGLLDIAKDFGLPIVATNDSHYLLAEHAYSHEILLCIQTGKTLADEKRMRFSTNEFYVKTPEEMEKRFSDHPDALKNTLEVAERCNFEFEFGNFIYPQFELPDGETPETVFKKLAHEQFAKMWPTIIKNSLSKKPPNELRERYLARLDQEIALIRKKGFASYFLIVQDFINWARKNDIPVGPGRGSAAGSLVSYVIRITDLDPIRYGLLFERFMNPERKDNPDIDIDFCAEGRDRVIEYTSQKYGKDKVSQIATFGTMKARAVVRDVGRAMGYPYGEVDRIAKMIPEELGITLEEAVIKNSDLNKTVEQESWVADLLTHAKVLEGGCRHISKHAAGLVIGDKSLVEYLPLTQDPDNAVITEWDKKDVEGMGLIKFDFLGLKTLTIINNTLRLIEENQEKKVDLGLIDMQDPKTFELLTSAKTTGVFQLESAGMKELLMRLRPSKIDDLIALVALYRPGPIGSGMIDNFINRKHGREEVTYLIPELEEHLAETYGMIVYQEQVMHVANTVGGFSLGDADLLRRAMSDKNFDVMARQKTKFLEGALERKIPTAKAESIWDLIFNFAAYGFNKSHSAAYGVVSYHTAYLKAHYPIEFMTALLTMDAGNSDKLMTKVAETREMGVNVLPPDINESVSQFSVSRGSIRFGLSGVKNVGGAAIELLVNARTEKGPFTGLNEFCEKIDGTKVNKRVIESLIKSGAFDSLNPNRAQLIKGVEKAVERAARIQRDKLSGQMGLFGGNQDESAATMDRFEEVPPWTEKEKLEIEKEVLGFFLSGHPLAEYENIVEKYADQDTQSLKDIPITPIPAGQRRKRNLGVEVRMAGIIASRAMKDYNGGRYARCVLEDMKGSVEFVIFNEECVRCEEKINSDEPLLVIGKAIKEEERGNVDLGINEMYYLKDVESILSKEAHFTLKAGTVEKAQIEGLKRLIERFPGKCRPIIHVEISGISTITCRLSDKYLLDPNNELVDEARRLFGLKVFTLR